nr:sugar nucleotide-binding protein [Acinetobacter baumannii]
MIADITVHAILQTLADASKVGIYHLVASSETSGFGYANYVFQQIHVLGQDLVIRKNNPILITVYSILATRPRNSRLNNPKIQHVFKLCLPNWQDGVKRTIMELLNK